MRLSRQSAAPSAGGRAALRRRVALVVGAAQLFGGCYTYVPLNSSPLVGSDVAVDISDAGRVALGDRLGPGVTRLEGRVAEQTPDELVLTVKSVSQVNVGRSRWSGESIRLRRDYVARSEQRQLSRGRTAAAVGAAVLGVVAGFVTRSLIGSGGSVRETPPNGTPGET